MDIQIAKEFHDACTAVFGFLVANHGFQPATLEINPRIHFATVSFLGRHVAVECIFDQNESWVEVKIAQVVNGARAGEYSTDSTGHRVRESLYPLLIKRGVRDFGRRNGKPSKKSLSEMFRIRLSKDADLLKKYGEDIINDSQQVFSG